MVVNRLVLTVVTRLEVLTAVTRFEVLTLVRRCEVCIVVAPEAVELHECCATVFSKLCVDGYAK
jgi:hypothetical protein